MRISAKIRTFFKTLSARRRKAFWLTLSGLLLSLPLSAGYVTYERGSGGGASGAHIDNLNEDAQTVGYPTDALRDAAILLGYGGNTTDADLFMAARGNATNDYPTPHPLQTASGDNISANQYEVDCDNYILVTSGVSGDGCADLNKTNFQTVKAQTEAALEYGYDSNQQRLTATGLGFADTCDGSDKFHEARGQETGRCNANDLDPPLTSDCSSYSSSYSLVNADNAPISSCGAMTDTQYSSFLTWVSGQADADAQQNCYENDLERLQAIALGYDGDVCADGKLYARALGRRLVNYPSQALLSISFASGSGSTLVQIADNQYEADCDAFIADDSDVSGDGCADLQRSQFASVQSNHDASQGEGYGGRIARTAAVAGSFATDCDGANAYYVSTGATTNPTLNPNCALQAPFTGLAGPACWDTMLTTQWYQHGNYEKSDFACVLSNSSTIGPRFTNTSLSSLTDGEFLYLKDCFYQIGSSRTVQGLRDCAVNATAFNQATFDLREISNATFGGGGSGSCNLTLAKIEELGIFEDLNENTYLAETKTLFDGNYCRRTDGSGDEVNCKEIVCDVIKNPVGGAATGIFRESNINWMKQMSCDGVRKAFKQKTYHYSPKKHYFIEACQAPVIATSDDFDILDWPMTKRYHSHYQFLLGRAPHQNGIVSGVAYWPNAGPESWEVDHSLAMVRFEHDPVPTSYVSNSGGVLTSAPRKNLRVYSFGNVSRHRQLSFQLEVEFKTNLCIGGGTYLDSSAPGEAETGRWYHQYNTQKIPFPVSILPNAVDAARNIRQRGAIEGSTNSVMSISLASSAGTASVGTFQAVTGSQTPFARDHFKSSDIGAVKITSLPAQGSLTYRASAVTANMILPSGDLAELKYQPPVGAPSSASSYSSFNFRTYAPWSSVETARNLTSYACREVPDFETTAANIPDWAWPGKATTSNWNAQISISGFGSYTGAHCSGEAKAATIPGGPDWTTPNTYQKQLFFTNITTPSDANSYTPSGTSLAGLQCNAYPTSHPY